MNQRVSRAYASTIKHYGFTIVELLVVIVVIGILAAISIVSYSGVTQRAVASTIKSDLDGVTRQLDLFRVDNDTYPLTVDCSQVDSATNKCLKTHSGMTYGYTTNIVNNSQSFCASAQMSGQSYRVTTGNSPIVGDCNDFGLVMHLDAGNSASYPGAGTSWNDLSGNNSNGTLVGGVTFSASNGGVMSFSGTNDYVSMPYAAQFNIRNAITLSAWVKRTSGFTQLVDVMVLARPPAWYFYDAYNSGNFRGEVFIDGVRRAAIGTAWPFDGSWYQIVYTYDSYTKTSKLYKNGVPDSTVTLSGLSNYLIDSSAANFSLIGHNASNRTAQINDMKVFNRALPAAEILQNFNSTKTRYGL
jgi:prepilin-type N-terminal cleavage/methylation domain-containing protein